MYAQDIALSSLGSLRYSPYSSNNACETGMGKAHVSHVVNPSRGSNKRTSTEFTSGADDAVSISSRKCPRLSWGQGLAKYEKERVGNPDELKDEAYEGVDGHISAQPLSWPAEILSPRESAHSLILGDDYLEPSRKLNVAKEVEGVEPLRDHSRYLLLATKDYCSTFQDYRAVSNREPTIELAMQIGNGIPDLAADHSSFIPAFDISTWSKDKILLHLEKVEFEIEQIEKELMKLENEICVKLVSAELSAEIFEVQNTRNPILSSPLPIKVKQMPSCAADFQKHPIRGSDSAKNIRSAAETVKITGNLGEAAVGISMDASADTITGSSSFHALGFEEGDSVFRWSKMVLPLIVANQRIANISLDPLAHLIPDVFFSSSIKPHTSPEETAVWKCNALNHERKKQHLQENVVQGKQLLKFKELALAFHYQIRREFWKESLSDFHMVKGMECHASNNVYLLQRLPLQLQAVATGCLRQKGVIEERQLHKNSCINSNLFQRAHVRMPVMLLDENERKFCKFVSRNRFVNDPVSSEQERKLINPWSAEERKTFLEMFSAFGKDFRKIASFLEHKRVADCVEFYYRNRKLDDFEKLHRRQRWKRRKDSSHVNALYLATTTSRNKCHHDNGAECVEGLTLVAAAAAAVSEEMGKVEHVFISDKAELKNIGKVANGILDNAADTRATSSAVSNTCTKAYTDGTSINQRCGPNTRVRKTNTSVISTGTKGARSLHSNSMKACNREMNSQWSDKERELFTKAVALFGKDFHRISLHVGTRSESQCKTFFSKTRKRLGLDQLVECSLAAPQALLDSKQVDFKQELRTGALANNAITDFGDVCVAPLPFLETQSIQAVRLGQAGRINTNCLVAAQEKLLGSGDGEMHPLSFFKDDVKKEWDIMNS